MEKAPDVTMASLCVSISNMRAERKKLQETYERERDIMDAQLFVLNDKLRLLSDSLDIAKIDLAEQCLEIGGRLGESLGRHAMLRQAMDDIAFGCPHMRKEYYGMKNYAYFGDQRSDHPYGYGPNHGSIVFSIGLKRSVRDRVRAGMAEHAWLTFEETEACLYYLMNYSRIAQIRSTATTATAP